MAEVEIIFWMSLSVPQHPRSSIFLFTFIVFLSLNTIYTPGRQNNHHLTIYSKFLKFLLQNIWEKNEKIYLNAHVWGLKMSWGCPSVCTSSNNQYVFGCRVVHVPESIAFLNDLLLINKHLVSILLFIRTFMIVTWYHLSCNNICYFIQILTLLYIISFSLLNLRIWSLHAWVSKNNNNNNYQNHKSTSPDTCGFVVVLQNAESYPKSSYHSTINIAWHNRVREKAVKRWEDMREQRVMWSEERNGLSDDANFSWILMKNELFVNRHEHYSIMKTDKLLIW